jgi:hypothetical protein
MACRGENFTFTFRPLSNVSLKINKTKRISKWQIYDILGCNVRGYRSFGEDCLHFMDRKMRKSIVTKSKRIDIPSSIKRSGSLGPFYADRGTGIKLIGCFSKLFFKCTWEGIHTTVRLVIRLFKISLRVVISWACNLTAKDSCVLNIFLCRLWFVLYV